MRDTSKLYRPSNGTEGMIFTSTFCDQCKHEKFSFTGNRADPQCDILTRTMYLDTHEQGYPEKWIYTPDGSPTCTKHAPWKWQQDETGKWNDPPVPEPEDPNQLKLF